MWNAEIYVAFLLAIIAAALLRVGIVNSCFFLYRVAVAKRVND